MNAADLSRTLSEFHREKLTLRQRHVAVAKQVADYDANNTYQYVIAREDVHLQWLEAAIAELAGTPDDVAEPSLPSLVWNESFTPLAPVRLNFSRHEDGVSGVCFPLQGKIEDRHDGVADGLVEEPVVLPDRACTFVIECVEQA